MAEEKEQVPRRSGRNWRPSRLLLWVVGILLSLALILSIASFFIDEPLRRMTEKKMNQSLKGYSVRLPEMHLRIIGFSVELKGLTIRQNAHPEPPVAKFPFIKASVHWREILSGKLVAELRVDDPRLHLNLQQLRSEVQSKVPMKEKGWQQAVEAIYPLKINLLKINDAGITYIDQDPKRPLTLTNLNLRADNIRNIHLPDKVYPSPFHLETDIFKTGHGTVDGRANFLAEPSPAIKSDVKLVKVPMGYFKPMLERVNFSVEGGVLSANGKIESGRKVQSAHFKEITVAGLKATYTHSEKTAEAEKHRAEKVKEAAKEVTNKPTLELSVDEFNLVNSDLGMFNDVGGKRYRVFMADTDFHLTNFSNQFSRGPAKARLSGKFMGTGVTTASGNFRPEKQGPDLDLYLKITNTQLTSLNPVLRAYGDFDVTAGTFSLVTELHVKDDAVTGYLKPFFKDMKVYDRRQDKKKGFFHQVYEMLIGGVAKILENKPRDQVATKADISGSLRNPRTSTWQIVVQLVKNAFFRAILPTFEKEAKALGKR